MLQYFMNQSFFTKMFASFLISSVIGALSITIVYHTYFKKVLIESEVDRVQQSINQSAIHLENILSRVTSDMDYFISFYESGFNHISLRDNKKENIEKLKNELETFQLRFDNELESVFYFKEDERNGQPIFVFTDNLSRIKDIDYKAQEWYKNYVEENQYITWTKPTEQHLFYQDRSIKSVWITIGRNNERDEFGVFVVRLNEVVFRDAFKELINENLIVEIDDEQNNLIYASSGIDDLERDNWINLSTNLEKSQFNVKVFLNQEIILVKVNKLQSIVLVVALLILVVIFLISLGLSLTLSRPVKKMLGLMRQVENGDFNVTFPDRYNDEIGNLGKGLNVMIGNLSNLIKENYIIRMAKMKGEIKQKESTILAMQNKINPHFLYNTLETINCLAIVHEVPSISKMSISLADFFRYSIKDDQIIVPLGQEMVHVDTYLEILHERYPDIDIAMGISNKFYRYPIIKLSLQPIIENTFKHAFNGDRDYYLEVYAYDLGEDDYVIVIEDNGEGMEESGIAKLNGLCQQISGNISSELELPNGEIQDRHGIGLLNVHTRICLRFGESYGIHVEESESGGLKVQLRLPKRGA